MVAVIKVVISDPFPSSRCDCMGLWLDLACGNFSSRGIQLLVKRCCSFHSFFDTRVVVSRLFLWAFIETVLVVPGGWFAGVWFQSRGLNSVESTATLGHVKSSNALCHVDCFARQHLLLLKFKFQWYSWALLSKSMLVGMLL